MSVVILMKPYPALPCKLFVLYLDRNEAYWIEGTRISLDSIVYAFRNGLSPESIIQSFPLLTLEQVYGTIAFYLAHQTEEEAEFDAMPQLLAAIDPALYNRLKTAKTARQ